MALRRQTKSARGGEIERARVASNLSDNTGEITAFEPLFQRKQSILRRARLDTNHPLTPLLRQAMEIRSSAQFHRAFVLHPQKLAQVLRLSQSAPCRALRNRSGKIQSIARQSQRQPCPAAIATAGKNLAMQGLIAQTGTPARLPLFRERAHIRCRETGIGRRLRPGKRGRFGHRNIAQRDSQKALCSYYVPYISEERKPALLLISAIPKSTGTIQSQGSPPQPAGTTTQSGNAKAPAKHQKARSSLRPSVYPHASPQKQP